MLMLVTVTLFAAAIGGFTARAAAVIGPFALVVPVILAIVEVALFVGVPRVSRHHSHRLSSHHGHLLLLHWL